MGDAFEQRGETNEALTFDSAETELKDSDIFSEDDNTEADLKKLREQVLLDLFGKQEVVERLEAIKALEKQRASEIVKYDWENFGPQAARNSSIGKAYDKALKTFEIILPNGSSSAAGRNILYWGSVRSVSYFISHNRIDLLTPSHMGIYVDSKLLAWEREFPVTYYLEKSPGRLKDLIDSGEIDINSYGGAFDTDVIPPKK